FLAKRSLYLDSQHVQSWQRIQEMESKQVERPPSPEMKFTKPNFTQPLQNFDNLGEGSSVRLQCRLEPVGDPTMRIQWLRNGQPIPQGDTTFSVLNVFAFSFDTFKTY